jgi:hypothetical protein
MLCTRNKHLRLDWRYLKLTILPEGDDNHIFHLLSFPKPSPCLRTMQHSSASISSPAQKAGLCLPALPPVGLADHMSTVSPTTLDAWSHRETRSPFKNIPPWAAMSLRDFDMPDAALHTAVAPPLHRVCTTNKGGERAKWGRHTWPQITGLTNWKPWWLTKKQIGDIG